MSIPSYATHNPRANCRSSAYLDWLQMLSGACLVIFMIMHLFFVGSVIISPSLMNGLSDVFEWTGMAQIGGPVIFFLLLLHFVLAARKIPFASKQQGIMLADARRMHHLDTWLWVIQAVSGMVILVMGSIHLWTVLTDLPITAEKNAMRLRDSAGWVSFYVVFIPIVWLHTGIGFYRIMVKWGVVGIDGRSSLRQKDALVVAAAMIIGFATLLRFIFLSK
ncbi:MAG TPA: succinate dehydrogenase/fumarate reductase cytochrome b subunit [Desulfobulbaceae bacterium]|nr:succinate dehydrogenase/fumarate reductase cytochrome b subunit [Desulfobulbaceae bacterium]